MRITREFHASMTWLHTWLGIALGGVLFAVFWMGTLTVFHLEINRWMMPETRVTLDVDAPLDPVVLPRLAELELDSTTNVSIARPSERSPLVGLFVFGGESRHRLYLDPSTGKEVTRTKTFGASDFFYPFHYSLHISPLGLGYWIVGLAAVSMLVLTITGIFIHRKIFREFFTFRPKKMLRRSMLDLHNLTAVVALPFHILFPLSGILIFALLYFPNAMTSAFDGDREAYLKAMTGYHTPEASGKPGPLPASLDALVARAEANWTERDGQPARADYLRILNAGDADAAVMVQHAFPERQVAMTRGNMLFDAGTGAVLNDFTPLPVHTTLSWIKGAHFVRVDSWALRWLFFLGGLAGSVMIASGLLFWMQARIRKFHEPRGVRVVRALTIGTVTGMVFATAAFMVANRLLPLDAAGLGLDRAYLEVVVFFGAWIVAFVHAGVRGRKAWREQCWAIAAAALLAPCLNWLTTGDDPLAAIGAGQWAIASIDLVLLLSAIGAVLAARRLDTAPVPSREPRRARPAVEPAAAE
ncbi:MAG: PepSY-associated TM helix domain-containing protein [Pseudomonadota bacterium]